MKRIRVPMRPVFLPKLRAFERRASGYTLVDYAAQTYMGVVAVLLLLFHGSRVPDWPLYVGLHLAGMIVVHGLVRLYDARPNLPGLDLIRHAYPLLFYVWFYRETSVINRMIVGGYLDPFFLRIEEAIFGFQPAVRFMEVLPYRAVSEVFYMAYFSYYWMILGVGVALYRQSRERFLHYLAVVSFVFYTCYLLYIFLPVLGPWVLQFPVADYPGQSDLPYYPLTPPDSVRQGFFFGIVTTIYRYFQANAAAFPSSHVAVSTCTLWFSWRYLPRVRYVHAVLVVLLCLSTVYCRYHYAVDVPAGLLAAAGLIPIAERLYRRFG